MERKRAFWLALALLLMWACSDPESSLEEDAGNDESDGGDTEASTDDEDGGVDISDAGDEVDAGEDSGPEELTCEGYLESDYPDVPATFEVEGDRAVMYGIIDSSTPGVVEELLQQNPSLEVLIMPFVPGSMDDYSNLYAARMVREAGLATCVPSTGAIASGGVDFFIAGVQRSAREGALLGVHSWGAGDMDGRDVPKDSPLHDDYIDYYEEMGIAEDFYWFTLEAAPADDIHWMTRDEIEEYELETE